jgi:hypothetical protein
MSRDRGGASRDIFALRRQVSLSSVPKVQVNSDTWRRSAKISLKAPHPVT